MDLQLKDKVAVITGGSKGIGLGIARAFAREGAHVVITARTASAVEAAARDIASEFGVTARAVASDVSTAEGCHAIAKAAADLGGADIFVSNAGTGSNETVAQAPDEKWMDYWNLHVMAAVRLSRDLADQMEAKGGGARGGVRGQRHRAAQVIVAGVGVGGCPGTRFDCGCGLW